MSNRSRIVLGSVVGAFAIHIAALACSGNGSVVGSQPDASTAVHDGGFVDALASVIDAVGDAVHDAAVKVVDGEVRDARAGGDPPRMMEAPCNVRGRGAYTNIWFATFTVPGLNPSTGGEIHAQACNYNCAPDAGVCASTGAPITTTCISQPVWSGPGSVAVYCGPDADHGATARIWIH